MRRWVVGGAAFLVALVAVTACGYWVSNARTFQVAGRLVDRIETQDKLVALTFDDGPTDQTPEVLRSAGYRFVTVSELLAHG